MSDSEHDTVLYPRVSSGTTAPVHQIDRPAHTNPSTHLHSPIPRLPPPQHGSKRTAQSDLRKGIFKRRATPAIHSSASASATPALTDSPSDVPTTPTPMTPCSDTGHPFQSTSTSSISRKVSRGRITVPTPPYLASFLKTAQAQEAKLARILDFHIVTALDDPLYNIVDLIAKISITASRSVPLLDSLVSILLEVGIKLFYVFKQGETSVAAILVIHPTMGDRIALVGNITERLAVPDTAELRRLFQTNANPWEALRISSPHIVQCVMELIQNELALTHDSNPAYSRTCIRCLRHLAREHGVLPPSFLLPNLFRTGHYPVDGGGYADIWRGTANGRVVCLKVLRTYSWGDARRQKVRKVFHEAAVWKQLDHPNILPLLGVNDTLFPESECPCLVSPWMQNGNIMKYLATHPDMDLLKALREIAAGMQYLHEFINPIVHADIRGANILVTDSGECCLADFGLVSVIESSQFGSSASSTEKGTVRWMAPELFCTGQLPNGTSSMTRSAPKTTVDVYAFGCAIVEIYTRSCPFPELKSDAAVIQNVSLGRLGHIRPVEIAGLTDELWELVTACCQRNPLRRPSARRITKLLRGVKVARRVDVS